MSIRDLPGGQCHLQLLTTVTVTKQQIREQLTSTYKRSASLPNVILCLIEHKTTEAKQAHGDSSMPYMGSSFAQFSPSTQHVWSQLEEGNPESTPWGDLEGASVPRSSPG